jgi:hypothetical protein
VFKKKATNPNSVGKSVKEIIGLLRAILPEELEAGLKMLANRYMNVLIDDINNIANERIGPREKRIGCFGPYTKHGWKVVQKMMEKVSDLGFAAITGRGFYLPNSHKFYPIKELMSPIIEHEVKRIRGYIFAEHFVKLTYGAIFYLNEIRTQFPELWGAYRNGIPSLGFIQHKTVSHTSNNCLYLEVKKDFSQCRAPERSLCESEYGVGSFCPFYMSINIPTSLRELLYAKGNSLFAVKNLSISI